MRTTTTPAARANVLPVPYGLELVGRIQSYLESPDEVLPVSCTVDVAEPSLFGERSITDSWVFTSRGLRFAAGVAVHLANFEPLVPVPEFKWRPYIPSDHPDRGLFTPEALEELGLPPDLDVSEPANLDEEAVLKVGDSMQDAIILQSSESRATIEESWVSFTELAYDLGERTVVVDLDLRPHNIDNGRGLVSSGPLSFCKIYASITTFIREGNLTSVCGVYSALNEVLRRGGRFKNGAITLHFDYDQPGALEFASLPREIVPWARLCLNIDQGFLDLDPEQLQAFLNKIETGDLFVVKKIITNGERIYHNVCLEILLRPRGTCLLAHINLGKVSSRNLPEVFKYGMQWLCEFRESTPLHEKNSKYLSPKLDRQVGLGVLGLANRLAIDEVTYRQFVAALESKLTEMGSGQYLEADPEGLYPPLMDVEDIPEHACKLVDALWLGFHNAAMTARAYNLHRAFTVAPTANCSFKARDSQGYTTAPEIAPPIDRFVDRDSGTMGVVSVDYHPDCERAIDVGYEVFFRLNCAWQALMDSTGLAHSISMNWWSDLVEMNDKWLARFLRSPVPSVYYALQVQPSTQDKSDVLSSTTCRPTQRDECIVCSE